MKWFYNLKIYAKLLISFILVALIAGVVGITGITNMRIIDNKYTDLFNQYGKPLNYIGDALSNYQRIRGDLRDLILDKGKDRTSYLNNLKNYNKNLDNSLTEFGKSINTDETRTEFNDLKSMLNQYKTTEDKIIQMAMANNEDEALTLLRGSVQSLSISIDDSFSKLQNVKVTNGNKKADDLAAETDTTVVIMIVIVVIAMIVAVILGLFISRIISKPVNEMVEAADKLAIGDIDVNVKSDTKDEIGSLLESFGRMIENIRGQALAAERIAAGDMTVEIAVKSENDLLGKKLFEMVEKNNEVLTNIASASEQVATGSKQVSDSSIALSQGATEQASAIEELTASLEEISTQTKLNAQNASQANELAEIAKSDAMQGNTQMREMLKAMEDINDSSSNISKIIKVIDEIAFQTNILALNAAVEAARAGQHGKGFAVVAEEVRNLAARSAHAAKETTDLIEGSIKKVEGGTRIARDTAEALNHIVNGIEKVAGLVNDIALASNEQATGVGQINQGIMQVSQVVQTNSATSEESAAASEELSSQAEFLKEMVGKFKLKQHVKSYSKLEELSPEVLRLLGDMALKKRNYAADDEPKTEFSSVKSKIVLSDKEFGKY